jgi:hypothetical protein
LASSRRTASSRQTTTSCHVPAKSQRCWSAAGQELTEPPVPPVLHPPVLPTPAPPSIGGAMQGRQAEPPAKPSAKRNWLSAPGAQ